MPYRILIVEDDASTLANLTDILELDGYEAKGVRSLKEAIAQQPWTEYSLILLDRTLPDGTADGLLPLIQQSAPHAASVVITGHADWDGVLAALRSGAADYLLKPVNGDMLRVVIGRVKRLQQLEEAMRRGERLSAIGQMATGIAHESRNALQRISASAEMLETELAGNSAALKYLATILRSQEELRRLLDEVRNFAAPIVLARRPCSVAEIWREAWALTATQRLNRDAMMNESGEFQELQIDVDRFRMIQVFRNLFENSLAAADDPVQIEVTCRCSVLNGARSLDIQVKDNGPGLTVEQRSRIFEPFFTTKQKGTGLGMAIVHRIIEAHGGTIEVAKNELPGAEFVLHLPVSDRT